MTTFITFNRVAEDKQPRWPNANDAAVFAHAYKDNDNRGGGNC